MQLLVGRQEDGAACRIIEHEGRLFCSEGRVQGDSDRSQQQAGNISHRPFGTIFAENGDAIARPNAPRMECPSGAGYASAKVAGRDRQPLSRLAVEQHAVEIAFDRGKENVVQRSDAHCIFRGPDGGDHD